MKKKVFLWLIAILVLSSVSVIAIKKIFPKEQTTEERLRSYERERKKKKQRKAAFSEQRVRYEFEMLKDPATGKIPAGIFEKEKAFAKTLPVKGSILDPAARVGEAVVVDDKSTFITVRV